MKKLLTILIASLFSITLLAGGGENPPADSPVAIMMKVVKDVTLKKAEADWSSVKIGAALSTNDEIKTGSQSLALIKFTDNSILRVRENSSLKIYADKNNKEISKNTYVDKGKVGFEVKRQGNEEFKFTTPTMVASIRGTDGVLDVDGDGNTTFGLSSGSANISATQGNKGQGTVTSGFFVSVGNDGNINIQPIGNNPNIQNLLNNNNNNTPQTKKLIIKTNVGDIIIEYIGDN